MWVVGYGGGGEGGGSDLFVFSLETAPPPPFFISGRKRGGFLIQRTSLHFTSLDYFFLFFRKLKKQKHRIKTPDTPIHLQIHGKSDPHVPAPGRDLIRTTLHEKNVTFSFYEIAGAQRMYLLLPFPPSLPLSFNILIMFISRRRKRGVADVSLIWRGGCRRVHQRRTQ